MGDMHAGWFRIHKAHKVGAHLMLGFFRQAYTVHAGQISLQRPGAKPA